MVKKSAAGPTPVPPLLKLLFDKQKENWGKGEGALVLQIQTHWIRNDLSKFEEKVFESIFIELKLGNVNIIFSALYRPPNKSNSAIDAYICILEETFIRVKKETKLLYLMGDFNFDLLVPDHQWCRFMLSIGGDNLQFYPNFALFSILGG